MQSKIEELEAKNEQKSKEILALKNKIIEIETESNKRIKELKEKALAMQLLVNNRISIDQSPKRLRVNKKFKTRNSSFVKIHKPSSDLYQGTYNIQSIRKNKEKLYDIVNKAQIKSRLEYKSSSTYLRNSVRALNKIKHLRNESMIYNSNTKDKDTSIEALLAGRSSCYQRMKDEYKLKISEGKPTY